MTEKIQKLIVKVPKQGQVNVPSEVLEALGVGPGDGLGFAIYADRVMLRPKNFQSVKVMDIEETQEKAAPSDESRLHERYTYYWSLRD